MIFRNYCLLKYKMYQSHLNTYILNRDIGLLLQSLKQNIKNPRDNNSELFRTIYSGK